jgi:hypothetical protein
MPSPSRAEAPAPGASRTSSTHQYRRSREQTRGGPSTFVSLDQGFSGTKPPTVELSCIVHDGGPAFGLFVVWGQRGRGLSRSKPAGSAPKTTRHACDIEMLNHKSRVSGIRWTLSRAHQLSWRAQGAATHHGAALPLHGGKDRHEGLRRKVAGLMCWCGLPLQVGSLAVTSAFLSSPLAGKTVRRPHPSRRDAVVMDAAGTKKKVSSLNEGSR